MAQSVQLKKVSWWHKSIVDWMLNNPQKRLYDCAVHFDVTQAWLSTIINSDMFKHYFELRRDFHSRSVSKSIVEKAEGLARVSLDVLHERIDAERATLAVATVSEVASMSLKALGFGGRTPGGAQSDPNHPNNSNTNVNVSVSIVDPNALARSRAAMRQLNGGITVDNHTPNDRERELVSLPAAG